MKAHQCQVDEIWAFTHCKQKNVATAKAAPGGAGDAWTWTAIDANSKLIISWLVGGRDGEYAMAFSIDLRARLANRVQLTSDGHRAYLEAVEAAFGADVDYAQLVKLSGASSDSAKGRYSPPNAGVRSRRLSKASRTRNTSARHMRSAQTSRADAHAPFHQIDKWLLQTEPDLNHKRLSNSFSPRTDAQ